MHGIPVEILRRVFHEAVLQARPAESTRMPIYISHVCRLWREISLSYGILWAYLSIIYDGTGGTPKRTVLIEVFDAFLRRTRGFALNFYVYFNLRSVEDREAHYVAEQIVERLILQQRRWQNVEFVWRFTASSNFTHIEFSRSGMPMLLSLILDTDIRDIDEKPVRPYVNISSSRRLGEIRLVGNYFLECGDQPISALTEDITLEFTREWEEWRAAKVCLDLLKIAPQCASLHAGFCTNTMFAESEPAQRDKPDQIIHHIKRLRLRGGDASSSVLGKLALPFLEDLFFEVDERLDAPEVLLKCIQRSLPPLIHLELSEIAGDEDFLIGCLRLLPTLRGLVLNSTEMSGQLFEELTCSGDTNLSSTFDRRVTCPSLKKLVMNSPLVGKENVPACADAFCTMVESRWKHLKSFRTVVLDKQRTDVCSIREFQLYLEYCFRPMLEEISILVEGAS